MPQGFVLDTVLFTLYTGPIGQIIRRHRLDFHLFADDSQLYVSFKINDTNDEIIALARIQACVDELKAWIIHHRLQLNDSKTEVLVFTTPSSAGKHNLTDVVLRQQGSIGSILVGQGLWVASLWTSMGL